MGNTKVPQFAANLVDKYGFTFKCLKQYVIKYFLRQDMTDNERGLLKRSLKTYQQLFARRKQQGKARGKIIKYEGIHTSQELINI